MCTDGTRVEQLHECLNLRHDPSLDTLRYALFGVIRRQYHLTHTVYTVAHQAQNNTFGFHVKYMQSEMNVISAAYIDICATLTPFWC